jgi:hypothetical protein
MFGITTPKVKAALLSEGELQPCGIPRLEPFVIQTPKNLKRRAAELLRASSETIPPHLFKRPIPRAKAKAKAGRMTHDAKHDLLSEFRAGLIGNHSSAFFQEHDDLVESTPKFAATDGNVACSFYRNFEFVTDTDSESD